MPCTCFRCSTNIGEPISRRDTCPSCGFDARVCKNCTHYDVKAYNECRENSADRVVDKEKSTYCDYFSPRKTAFSGATGDAKKSDAVKKLDDLFK